MTVNKAAPLFLLSGPSLVALAATQQSAALRRWGDARTRPAPLVIQEIAVSALSRAEFGCHYTDMEIEWRRREASVLWYQKNA